MDTLKKHCLALGVATIALIASYDYLYAADLDPVEAPAAIEAKSPLDNFYISLFGGVSVPAGDTDFSNGAGLSVDSDFDTGFLFGGSVGYKWKDFSFSGITPRTELEVNYFQNNVDSVDFSGNGAGNEVLIGDNQISGVGVFGNLFFDWNNAFGSGITPYAGGGVGVAFVDTDILYNSGSSAATGLNLSDDDTAFAFNVGAGASYDVTERLSLFVDARYLRILDVDSERRVNAAPAGGNFEDDLSNIVIRSGLSVSF